MSHDLEIEPVEGLPHELPAGEDLIWQGHPSWKGLARHTFYVPWIAAYFGALVVARGIRAVGEGASVPSALWAVLSVGLLAAVGVGLLCLLAVLHARGTVYTITSKRVVMRFGVALPMSFNLPFKQLAGAELKLRADGSGDLPLRLSGRNKIAYVHLWPHARPFRFSKPQPMLRAIPDAARVARLLAEAVKSWSLAQSAGQIMLGTGSEARPPAPTASVDGSTGVGLGDLASQAGR